MDRPAGMEAMAKANPYRSGNIPLPNSPDQIPPLMNKNREVVSELVSKDHPFHQAETRPKKAEKHRYERRKVKGILKDGDWEAENPEDANPTEDEKPEE